MAVLLHGGVMSEPNILQFPNRALPDPDPRDGDLLAKLARALRAMKELHAELETLRSKLKAENSFRPIEPRPFVGR
jgi:hypothetical protein